MKTIENVEYVNIVDLAALWDVGEHRLRSVKYRSLGEDRPFPTPDINSSRLQLWRSSRLPELDAWWKDYEAHRAYKADERAVETVSREMPAAARDVADKMPTDEVSASRTVFQGMDISLYIAHDFPAFRDSHVLAVVRRHNGEIVTEHFFITREQAQMIEDLFNN